MTLILPRNVDPAERWPNLFNHRLDVITGNLWGINKGGGRFFAASRGLLDTKKKLDMMKALGITYVEAHDTDILDLVLGAEEAEKGYPEGLSEPAKMRLLDKAVTEFEKELRLRGMTCGMFTMNLFNSSPLFVYGNLGSQNVEARALAIRRTKVGLSIAQRLGCIYVYWVGTNGVNGLMSANHTCRYGLLFDALVRILKWHRRVNGDAAVPMAGEAKPEEPMWRMYAPVTQSFLWLSLQIAIQYPSLAGLLGVNPEQGHEQMVKLDPAMTLGEAMAIGLLYHIHFNDQGGDPGFDRDGAAGATSLRGLVDMIWQLHNSGYTGLLGLDVQPRPTDTSEQQEAALRLSVCRIRWAVDVVKNKINPNKMRGFHAAGDQVAVEEYIDEVVFGI